MSGIHDHAQIEVAGGTFSTAIRLFRTLHLVQRGSRDD